MEFGEFVLETDRLILRKPKPVDAADIYAFYSDAEVMKYWSRPPYTSIEEAHEMIAHRIECWETNDSLCFAMARKEDGVVIGMVNLFSFAKESRRAEIGYILARPFWGEGYTSEGVDVVLAYGFEQLKLNRIEADIDPANVGSAALLNKMGFTREGVLRQRWIVNGVVSDSHIFGLLSDEYSSRLIV